MKKILSITLATVMLLSIIPTVFAAENNWQGGTKVEYTATANEQYTVTVPATLAPGGSGDVVASGTWGSDRKLTVTADKDVTLTNSINAADQKVLDVTFAGIELTGSNTESVSDTKQVTVVNITDAIFGTWSGTFNYNVAMSDVAGGTEAPTPDDGGDESTVSNGSATFSDGVTLSWDELLLSENATKYGYTQALFRLSDTNIGGAIGMGTQLVSIDIPDSIVAIGDKALQGCTNLKSITLHDKITSIGKYAFNQCTSLSSIDIPEGVTRIEDATFAHGGLVSIAIPDSVTHIGTNAFSDSLQLVEVNLGAGLENVNGYAFSGCTNLTKITYAGTMEQWNAITFGNGWKSRVPATEVICSNGTVSLS